MEYYAMLDLVMSYDSENNRAADEWGRKNPQWILVARLVPVGIVIFIVWKLFFSEPVYTDYELRNLPYQEEQPEQCYGLGGSYPC